MKPEELFGKDYNTFASEDPFNPNFVEGYISRHQGDDYGAVLITKVNGQKVPQLIYCTPKINYPFDRNGNWHFPKAKKILRFEKLDGTNIFAYRYHDEKSNEFFTYKTRLSPFVVNSKFGPFQEMLKEMLNQTPILSRLALMLGMNLSFELWGARNPHLVLYDTSLALSFLFARNGQKILPPTEFPFGKGYCAPLRGIVEKDYIWNYQESQKDMENNLKETEDAKYRGTEGEVWYLQLETGDWILFKCKPNSIEMVHWAAGGIGKNVIRATCQNAFENWDEPTVDNVVSLLLEEFTAQEVEKAYYSIKKHLQEALEEHKFKERVLNEYEQIGINLLEDKVTVMRHLSTKFPKDKMKKVYSTIWAEISS